MTPVFQGHTIAYIFAQPTFPSQSYIFLVFSSFPNSDSLQRLSKSYITYDVFLSTDRHTYFELTVSPHPLYTPEQIHMLKPQIPVSTHGPKEIIKIQSLGPLSAHTH